MSHNWLALSRYVFYGVGTIQGVPNSVAEGMSLKRMPTVSYDSLFTMCPFFYPSYTQKRPSAKAALKLR